MEFILVGMGFAVAAVAVAAIFFKKSFVWWEYLILGITPPIIAVLVYITSESTRKWDTEYFTNTCVKVEYVEYWETWVDKTCSRTYSCNCTTDSKGHKSCDTCTEYYDCSYCDENGPYYYAYNEKGKRESISESEYRRISKKFGTERFVELNRYISRSGLCGKDGDSYVAEWNGDESKYEPFCTAHKYENKVRLSNAYNFVELSESEKKRVKDYPDIYGVYQDAIVGQWFDKRDLYNANFKLNRFNGQFGKKKQIKAFIFTYYNQNNDVMDLQRRYFEGGNKNEIIICVGYAPTVGVTWVRAFSWTDEKICENEAVRFYTKDMKLEQLVDHMIPVWTANWKRKEFTPLNDIVNIVPTTGAWITMIILVLIITTILTIAFKQNQNYNGN